MARTYRKLPPISSQDIQRFWAKVDKTSGQGPNGDCWQWTATVVGSRPANKYGFFKLSARKPEGGTFYAHRVSYQIHYGNLQENKQVCHRCDNTLCVRPDHLWLGSQQDNMRDYFNKGFTRNHPAKGQTHHLTKLTDNDVKTIRSKATRLRGDVKKIAVHYGIDRHTLLSIRKRKTWKHVTV